MDPGHFEIAFTRGKDHCLFKINCHIKTLNHLGEHLSFKHIRLLYADTGLNYFSDSVNLIFIDSLYWAQCCDTLEQMISKEPNDMNHYSEDEIPDQLRQWSQIKDKLFVTGTTHAEKREPLLWKEEYSTNSTDKGEMICLSP